MIEKLNELKIRVNNIYDWNIDILKDEIDTFINTYINNKNKKDIYLNELKYISFDSVMYELDDDYFNPWWAERNRQAKIEWFFKGKKELTDLLLKIENFLESKINIKEKQEEKLNININNLNNNWNFAIKNEWEQSFSLINNEIEKIIELIDKKDIENKEDIKKILNDFEKTNDKSKLVDVFSILWNWASINSMIIALSSLINW